MQDTMKSITSPIFAILTPFNPNGTIDFTALTDYLSFLTEKGVSTILTNGTTAEFPSLTLAERMALLTHCRKNFTGRILNNISSCCLMDCLELAQQAQDYADGLVLLPPFYYAHAAEAGIIEFLEAVLAKTTSPVYLYNFPKHTQNPLTPSLIKPLLKYKHLVGIKDSQADLEMAAAFKSLKQGKFQVFIGGDRIALAVLKQGLDGSVTGGGNAFPELLVGISDYFQSDNLAAAEKMQTRLNIWNEFRKQGDFGEIPLTKLALQVRLNHFPLTVRAPLVTRTVEELAKMKEAIEQVVVKKLLVNK